jgi:Fic family protein
LRLCVEYRHNLRMNSGDNTTYIWQLPRWPDVTWSHERIAAPLAEARHRQGRLLGRMEALGFPLKAEATLQTLTQDVLKSSEIEGERLDPAQVRSSIARRLGIDIGALAPADRNVEGVVEMMLDATQHYDRSLTDERLFAWHAALFPTGRSGMAKIRVGMWRDDSAGPMQVTSGPVGKKRVHYEAPPAPRLAAEMSSFLAWFNREQAMDFVLKAAVAHLRFVTIHPFDDGNGRVARAIADMALARSERSSERFYSMSAQIRQERDAYYDVLEQTQKGSLDITAWIEWFLGCLSRAIERADQTLAAVIHKARFWERHGGESFNERQIKVLNRMLDGIEGKLTSSKWAKLAKCSQDTAYRDITDLVARGVLRKDAAGGRSTSYSLTEP